jgi:hypothetical protein
MNNRQFKINFIVHSPFPDYISHIGGVAVAHALANELKKTGENVYMYANTTDPRYDIPCIPHGTELDFDVENTIVIIIAGAGEHLFEHTIPEKLIKSNVVRWLVHDQQRYYDPAEKLYMHNPCWTIIPGQHIDGHLCVFEIEDDIFMNKGLERSGTCYLVKGHLDTNPERAIHTNNDYCIDDILYTIPNSERRKFLAELFNTKEYFISYSSITFTSLLAAMCGCKSIIIPKNTEFDKEKWLNSSWSSKYGIAYGLDDLPRAIDTMDKVMPNVQNFKYNVMPQQINKFIDDCYDWLTLKYNITF